MATCLNCEDFIHTETCWANIYNKRVKGFFRFVPIQRCHIQIASLIYIFPRFPFLIYCNLNADFVWFAFRTRSKKKENKREKTANKFDWSCHFYAYHLKNLQSTRHKPIFYRCWTAFRNFFYFLTYILQFTHVRKRNFFCILLYNNAITDNSTKFSSMVDRNSVTKLCIVRNDHCVNICWLENWLPT